MTGQDYQYILLFAIIAITGLYTLDATRYTKKGCICVATVILTLFSGLRTWWMGDLIKYYTLYVACNGDNWIDTLLEKPANIGIRLFFRLSGAIGMSYEFCIFTISAFVAIALGLIIYKYSPSPLWSYIIYLSMGFFIFTFSGLKQAIAMGFITFAFSALVKRRNGSYVAWTLVAAFFHMPALIFFLVYPFAKKKIDKYYFLMLAAFALMVFLLRDPLAGMMNDVYGTLEEEDFSAKSIVGGRAIVMLVIIILGTKLRPLQNEGICYTTLFSTMFIAFVLQLFSVYDNVFTRLADYCFQFVVLYIPMWLVDGANCYARKSNTIPVGAIPYARLQDFLLKILIFAVALYSYSGETGSFLLDAWQWCWQIDPYTLYGA